MKSFLELERLCQNAFLQRTDYWHAYTCGKDTSVLFATDEDLAFAMNAIALAFASTSSQPQSSQLQPNSRPHPLLSRPSLEILSFEVMNNHFHFVAAGSQSDILAFFTVLIKKLQRTIPKASSLKLSFKPISNISSLRNHIVYVHRNGYVANPNYTPFSYPWGTGVYYFNKVHASATFSSISYSANRAMFRGRNADLPGEWEIIDTYIAPNSYCSIALGMSMFRDAHHYFSMISKNVESYSEMAAELGDGEFLTDQELLSRLQTLVHEKYALGSLRDLTKTQRFELARSLHYDYRSSNGQISRVLGLSQYETDSLFPLGKK